MVFSLADLPLEQRATPHIAVICSLRTAMARCDCCPSLPHPKLEPMFGGWKLFIAWEIINSLQELNQGSPIIKLYKQSNNVKQPSPNIHILCFISLQLALLTWILHQGATSGTYSWELLQFRKSKLKSKRVFGCMYTCTYVYYQKKHVFMYTCTCVDMYIYIYTHTHNVYTYRYVI